MTGDTTKLRDLIERQAVVTIEGMRPVTEALGILDACGRHAVGVMLDGEFVGIFSYADFVHRVVMKGRHPRQTLIMEVTTMDPVTVSPDCGIHEAFDLMCKRNYSHLPVLSHDKKLLGIVSHDDLRLEIAKSVKSKTEEADYLRAYVSGESYGSGDYQGSNTNTFNKRALMS